MYEQIRKNCVQVFSCMNNILRREDLVGFSQCLTPLWIVFNLNNYANKAGQSLRAESAKIHKHKN